MKERYYPVLARMEGKGILTDRCWKWAEVLLFCLVVAINI